MTGIIFAVEEYGMMVGMYLNGQVGFAYIPELESLVVTGHQIILFVGVVVD